MHSWRKPTKKVAKYKNVSKKKNEIYTINNLTLKWQKKKKKSMTLRIIKIMQEKYKYLTYFYT